MISGKSVLIVEDNCLLGEVIAQTIAEAGGRPVGPASSEREAFDLIEFDAKGIDAAILDIRLDVRSFGVADRLQSLGVPFVFASGNCGQLPEHLRTVPVCEKPYTLNALMIALDRSMREGRR
jgi:CheY-like chemotaxis protein